MKQPDDHGVSAVVYAIVAFGVVSVVAADLLVVVPDLFNRHDTSSDLLAVGSTIAVLACAYLVGRFLWRAIQKNGDEE